MPVIKFGNLFAKQHLCVCVREIQADLVTWFLSLASAQVWQARYAIASSLPKIRILIPCATIAEVSCAMLMITVPTAMTGLTNCGKD